MPKEILIISEEHIEEVVRVIRSGLRAEVVSTETRRNLDTWCDDFDIYLNEHDD